MTHSAIIPGDGIGAEMIAETLKVHRTLSDLAGTEIETVEFDYGANRNADKPL